MDYATPAELIAAAPENLVANLTGTDTPDTVAIQRALNDAFAEIDGYLAGRYVLPLASVPPVLRRVAIDIAMYRLQNLRGFGDLEDSRKRYEDAIAYLKMLAKGEVSLGLSTADTGSAAPTGIAYSAPDSIMTNLGY
ncbi:DUF1320 domain-containing protein [bacterium (Candidatus Blackallbacteria) CG13_big_fil_rev_8_21_14_2_50_49_14]|nr:MAG: hypothetical protein COW64_15090 [bacterium (Candidatus Blackallbacteria) CG18_big_fil_WC_8_21_14_2_50_49_26]PIW46643.1 MAG: DUF1320 domain-containing protein [bacterium (Candidatus Blackallbacteria) CG13_big_fil_rev_8_21_14_2_50_49_14]